MSFDLGSGLNTVTKAVSGAFGSVSSALTTAGKLAGALNNLSNPAALISSLRSLSLPKGGEAGVASPNAVVNFGDDGINDWRVRLSVPPAFASSGILKPLVDVGGLIFPYTPSITISSSAMYEDQAITHQNYAFIYYQGSKANEIQIEAPFNVEDGMQGRYWLAAVHMLRSCTKMFTGDGDLQGNPPPILRLNGYGDYVFKNIPVVVKSFSVNLPQDVNYINTSSATAGAESVLGSGASPTSSLAGLSSAASGFAGLAGALGANKVSNALGAIGAISSLATGVSKIFGGSVQSAVGGGPFATTGNSWVPTKSSISITLQPIYSREAMRQFSLQRFVNGDYVSGGYI